METVYEEYITNMKESFGQCNHELNLIIEKYLIPEKYKKLYRESIEEINKKFNIKK